jgi:hypothetical protein
MKLKFDIQERKFTKVLRDRLIMTRLTLGYGVAKIRSRAISILNETEYETLMDFLEVPS